METVRVVLVVGLLLVLPQVMGFVASRLGRRRYAGLWPLAAAGTVAVYWALFAFYDYREGQRAIATGELRCGTGAMAMHYLASLLLGAHGALGSFLSMLDPSWAAALRLGGLAISGSAPGGSPGRRFGGGPGRRG